MSENTQDGRCFGDIVNNLKRLVVSTEEIKEGQWYNFNLIFKISGDSTEIKSAVLEPAIGCHSDELKLCQDYYQKNYKGPVDIEGKLGGQIPNSKRRAPAVTEYHRRNK